MKSRLIVLVTFFVFIYILFNRFDWTTNRVFQWDKAGYYSYLPALFIYQDIDSLNFYPEINQKYHTVDLDIPFYALYDQSETGKRLNKYAIGVAVAEFPFFLIAHFATQLTETYPADGYSAFYQLGVMLASIAWTIFGLVCLRSLLKRYFPDYVVLITILLLAFGTNLYHYAVFDGGMSHAFSFSFFAAALNSTDLFYRTGRKRHFWLGAFWLGLIVITRPTNIVFVIVLLFWGIRRRSDLARRFQMIFDNKSGWIVATFILLAVFFVQLSYWKYITGNWIHYSYEEEGFNFLRPEIWNGLFSYRKGWFVYTPLAFISLFGFIFLWKKYPHFCLACLSFLLVHIYIVFSWHQWFYGGGFGARPMVESWVVLAVPLACLISWVSMRKRNVWKIVMSILFPLIVALNIWQTYQFSLGTIPWDHNNKEYYWKVFFKKNPSSEDWELLNL